MKILITGANGFLGKHIVNELKTFNDIKSLSQTCGDFKISLEKEIPNFGQKFNLVIHAAGKAHSFPRNEVERKAFYDINVLGTKNLLEGLRLSGIPSQFVFISSVSVYGREKGINIKESDPLEAKDSYGLSKIEAEKLVINWCENHNVKYAILRLPLIVGKNPPGNLGAMIKAIEKKYYFNIGGGNARKSMVLASDVAKFLPDLASVGGIYNLTDGIHPSFYELSETLSYSKNIKKPINLSLKIVKLLGYIGDLFGDKAPINSMKIKKITSSLTFDDSKVKEVMNWQPQSVLNYIKTNDL